jgi:hypothetical protein
MKTLNLLLNNIQLYKFSIARIMEKMKQLFLLVLMFPMITYGQIENLRYKRVVEYVIDSIIKNDYDNCHISNLIERKTEFFDFHGLSKNCEIQHKLLLEILINGEQLSIKESNLSILIPDQLENESNDIKIELGTIISYKDIWATVIQIRNTSKLENEWTTYSLLFVGDILVGKLTGNWHGD